MDLDIVPSRAGPPSCRAEGAWLHSRYDPASEASRFAAEALGGRPASTVIILGACLDYLSAEVRRLLPRAAIVSVQLSSAFRGREISEADFRWYPDSGQELDSYLYSAIGEDSISGVAVVSWSPAESAFPDAYREAAAAVRISLDRLASSSATVKVFGKAWIANACRSFLLAESAAVFGLTRRPVVVAAAGPSLGSSLEELKAFRDGFLLVAVSSALASCNAAGLAPDLVVSTDGGNWSRFHLYPLSSASVPLASPLTAIPSACLSRRNPFFILDQGSFPESQLLPLLGAPASAVCKIPPHGTVSGTALLLASRLSSGKIIAAGLDLARRGDKDHERPHGFDFLADSASRRLLREETIAWSRSHESCPDPIPGKEPWASSRSLASYASGLDASLAPFRERLFRLNPSPVELRSFAPVTSSELGTILPTASSTELDRGDGARISVSLAPAAKREELLRGVLSRWRTIAIEAAKGLASGKAANDPLVSELLRSIDIVDYAAARRAILSGGDPEPASLELERRSGEFIAGLAERLSL